MPTLVISQAIAVVEEISSHEKDLDSKKGDLKEIDGEIANKNKDLEKINQLIIEKGEEPIQLSAGKYIIGADVPAGRYKVMPIGRGSNFITYGANGRLDVNKILGAHGEAEYIFFADDGGTIDSRSTVKLVPVE